MTHFKRAVICTPLSRPLIRVAVSVTYTITRSSIIHTIHTCVKSHTCYRPSKKYALPPFINSESGFFRESCYQNLSYLNKTAHGDKTQLPPMSHQGLMNLSLLPAAAITCTKQQISRDRPQTKTY